MPLRFCHRRSINWHWYQYHHSIYDFMCVGYRADTNIKEVMWQGKLNTKPTVESTAVEHNVGHWCNRYAVIQAWFYSVGWQWKSRTFLLFLIYFKMIVRVTVEIRGNTQRSFDLFSCNSVSGVQNRWVKKMLTWIRGVVHFSESDSSIAEHD